MYTNMYISTMQFGPVMSPRLNVRVRLLPGKKSKMPLVGFPGGLKTIGIAYVQVMKFGRSAYENCCGSLGMSTRASDRHTCLHM